ncbi:uncharacterized protein ACIBXB_002095 isoform 2-T11 [Morphnus guianensis]
MPDQRTNHKLCAKSPKRPRGMFPEELQVAADVQGVVLPSQVESAAKTTAGRQAGGVYSPEGAALPDLQLPASGDATFGNNQTLRDFSKTESNTPIGCCTALASSGITE